MKLYEISARYEQILDRMNILDPAEDHEAIALLQEELSALDDDAETKAVHYAAKIKNSEAEIHAIDNAIKDMQDRKKSLQSQTNRMCDYLKYHLEKCGIKEVRKSPYFKITLKEGRDKVDIIDQNLVPNDYLRCKMLQEIDKIKALKEMQDGVVIPGLIIKRELTLYIK